MGGLRLKGNQAPADSPHFLCRPLFAGAALLGLLLKDLLLLDQRRLEGRDRLGAIRLHGTEAAPRLVVPPGEEVTPYGSDADTVILRQSFEVGAQEVRVRRNRCAVAELR